MRCNARTSVALLTELGATVFVVTDGIINRFGNLEIADLKERLSSPVTTSDGSVTVTYFWQIVRFSIGELELLFGEQIADRVRVEAAGMGLFPCTPLTRRDVEILLYGRAGANEQIAAAEQLDRIVGRQPFTYPELDG